MGGLKKCHTGSSVKCNTDPRVKSGVGYNSNSLGLETNVAFL